LFTAGALLVSTIGVAPVAAARARDAAPAIAEEPLGAETSAAGRAAPSPDRPLAEIVREADAAFARGDDRTARALYEQAVFLDGTALHPLRRLALLQAKDGDLRAAVATYRRAVALAPEDLDLALELAAALSAKNEVGDAIDLYQRLRTAHPDDARVLLGLAKELIRKQRFDDAEEILAGMEERRLDPIGAHLARARILILRGDAEHAERFYRDVARADPGNLEARIGLARMQHQQGLDRKAREQADNIVLDHPESREARSLQQEIHLALRPRIDLEPVRRSDDGGNRVDSGTAAYTFMAEPQTAVRIAYDTVAAEFRCDRTAFCDEVVAGPPGSAVDRIVSTRAQTLTVAATSRLLRPLNMNAWAGAMREDSFGDATRTVAIGGGWLRWQVGPRFGLMTDGGREPLLDTARLIDRGLKVDRARLRLEYRLRPGWRVTGSGEYAAYSDRNARETADMAVEWRLPSFRPKVAATFEARYRRFHDGRDNGYFDPLRYDSEAVTVEVGDQYRDGRLSWRVSTTYGRQRFDPVAGALLEARPGETVRAIVGSFGAGLGTRAGLEAFYARSDDALQAATGFTASRAGIVLRFRP